MKKYLLVLFALFSLSLHAENIPVETNRIVDVVFCLDSTGSMSGLIEGAKQKIWAIANSMIALKPTPKIRIGLISYRDRGDEYVTRKYDLTEDIDAVFEHLTNFRAEGGGDRPESVNQALHEAVHDMSWTKTQDALKIIFLVGDAPPHMDYKETPYPETCQSAAKTSIIINTVQCGMDSATTTVWKEIARLAEGSYIALPQSGGMMAITTPYDEDIAKISREIGGTTIAYGTPKQKESVGFKLGMAMASAPSVAADRAAFNAEMGGRAIQGRGDLVADLAGGQVALKDLKKDELPEEFRKLTPAEQVAYIEKKKAERDALNQEMLDLARQRSEFLEKEKKRLAEEGQGDGFDSKITEIIEAQARRK